MDVNNFKPMPYRQIKVGRLTLKVHTNGYVDVDLVETGPAIWQYELNEVAKAAQEFMDEESD